MPLSALPILPEALVLDGPVDYDEQALTILGFEDFEPVPVRYRNDGWTPAKQRRFLVRFSETASVTRSARAVGMSTRSAYRLMLRPDAASFAEAWRIIAFIRQNEIECDLNDRLSYSSTQPVFYRGRQVGTRPVFNAREAIRLLRAFEREIPRLAALSNRQTQEG